MNKVVHFEIPYDDQDRATKFYREVFGWQITKFPDMDYHLAITTPSDEKTGPKEPGAINGGMLKKDPTGEHPLIVIDVPSIDDHIKKITESGGKVVMPKMEVGTYGLYARVSDTEGNVIGIWQTLGPC
ncbi:glyoxalase [Nitrosopumilus sp. b1]|uniref:VOC family protein n=1 Tax=Nitrosopumilus sp. b1 TaxID=2109907 RepID=UPI0015F674F6|nr:VOC family protein [Nitrosopumilus sp. b1]KAF6243195.1 glyoxalase [Nitrosopumilus sp. b1]